MLHNFEVEKQQKNEEITQLNNQLLSLMNSIDKSKSDYEDNLGLKKTYQDKLDMLSDQNKELLREKNLNKALTEEVKIKGKASKNESILPVTGFDDDIDDDLMYLAGK